MESKDQVFQKSNEYYQNTLKKLFDGVDDSTIREIISTGKQITIRSGEFLFNEGDLQKEIFLLIKGRLRAISTKKGEHKILGDIGAGEAVGELSFFTGEARMATILAIRDSLVLKFSPEKYLELIAANPQLSLSIIKLAVNRIRQNTFEQHKSSPPKNIALIKLQEKCDIEGLMLQIKNHLSEDAIPIQTYEYDSSGEKNVEMLFDQSEQHEGLNIMICDDEHKEWSKQCLIYADLVLVVSDYCADESIYEIEKYLNLYTENILKKRTYFILVHPEEGEMPSNTKKWLKKRPVDLHLHIRKNNIRDIRRIGRIIRNKAIGLVLGGGGAKGFAHIGVVKALNELGIEIDFLGGTSAGALYGIGMSFADFDFDKINELNRMGVKRKLTSGDLNFPLISLKKGKKFKLYLKEMFSQFHLEDLWVNSFCITTNLSNSTMGIHKDGEIWRNILASMAIPGVFPPIVIGKSLHVDGGVMDNLPIEPMYDYPVDKIIAVSLTNLDTQEVNYTEIPNLWHLLLDKIFRKKHYRIPGITSILVNSLTINSQQKQLETKAKVSHFIGLQLKGFGLLDDKKWKEIQQKGYEQTIEYFKNVEF